MTEKKSGNVFVISAPSGCGKTTVVKKVIGSTTCLERSVSVTTRKPRTGERPGRDYQFISENVFKRKVKNGDFLEWAQNFGYYYGTLRKHITDVLKKGSDIILTIDVKGAAQIQRKMPGSVLVFIMPPNCEELARRLKKRATDDAKAVEERLRTARREITQAAKYDYHIVNDNLSDAVLKLKAIIIAKRCEIKKARQRSRKEVAA
ncbi:MAG: guanylate kinase [Candidatus Omnitrophica bacterium]|nr:guanylate kinase [Candidatus Omnitrophota bacterium]